MEKQVYTIEDGSSSHYYHSASGRLERIEDYSPSGALTLSVLYHYNDKNQNVERVILDANGKQVRRLVFEFDAAGRECIHREYDATDSLLFSRPVSDV